MNFDIDIAIVAAFLLVNLGLGLYIGKATKTVKEYAIGNRNFSTATIAATIIATWISGSDFAVAISETYKEGLWYLVAGGGDIFALLIIAHIFGPRMKEFFGSLSVAEAMGNMYGQKIRIVTAVASIAQGIGQIALQIKIFSTVFNHFLNLPSVYATLASSFVVIVYSAWGGIKSVTFTDAIQFLTFGVFIPIFALFIWHVFGNTDLTLEAFHSNPLFDYTQLIDINGPKFWPYFFLLLYFSIPSFNSTMFQRTLMARDTAQIRQSFTTAAIVALFVHLFSCFIGLIVLSHTSTLDPNNIIMYVIDTYFFTGLKGITAIGILAMIMSTADSWINTGSIIFVHDFCKPIGIKFKDELLLTRIFAVFLGTVAVILALEAQDLLKLLLLSANFYKPIVTVPLILAILGFRSSTKAVVIGMLAGGLTVIVWKLNITPITGIDSVIPAMSMNLIAYMGSHYLLREPGGWVGIKDDSDLRELKRQRQNKIASIKIFFSYLPNFALLTYCNRHIPKNDILYSYFAFGSLTSIITTFSLNKIIYAKHIELVNSLQGVSLFVCMIFICRNLLWSERFKERYVGLMWHISIFVSLAFISSLLVFISKFSQISLVIFILNLTMIGMLLSWQSTLVMVITGLTLAFYTYKYFMGAPISSELHDLKLKVIYIIFIFCSFMLAFLKPKQEYIEETEHKIDVLEDETTKLGHEVTDLNGQVVGLSSQVSDLNEQVIHYSERVVDQAKEIERLGATAQKILNNVNHELRLPIGNVMNFSDMLHEALGKSDNRHVQMLSEEVHKSSTRVSSMILNMLDLATLDVKKVDLQKTLINFSELVTDRVKTCRKIYLKDKKIDFELMIAPEVMGAFDPNYIRQTVDNLVINAINFSEKGVIKVSVTEEKTQVVFTIIDQGKGIPTFELSDIFTPFKMGSNTESKAEGRGVGLALCKSAVEAHGGSITARSNGEVGATLRFVLPL